ncbi:MAG: hypothetical protein HYU37_03695 [Acidobacteria bacterium]|nr:hypothetical protein [Acidobacteriota bacterium]
MANATLSPKQLAALLSMLDDAQHRLASVRAELIQAMAARRRAPPRPRRPTELSRRTRIAR